MKLTVAQIEKINQTLMDKGLVYDDIKLELIDHIATDIEAELENTASSFEMVYARIFNKWESALKITSSYRFNLKAPKIVISKLALNMNKLYKLAFLSAFMFSFLMATITKIYPQETTYSVLKLVFVSAYSLVSIALVIYSFLLWKLKSKTIFGIIFKGYFFLSVFGLYRFTFLSGDHLYRHYARHPFISHILEWFIHSFCLFIGVCLIQMAKEHFKTIKRYNLV